MKLRYFTIIVLLFSMFHAPLFAQNQRKIIKNRINSVLDKDSDANWVFSTYVGESARVDEIEETDESNIYLVTGSFKYWLGPFSSTIDPFYAEVKIYGSSIDIIEMWWTQPTDGVWRISKSSCRKYQREIDEE